MIAAVLGAYGLGCLCAGYYLVRFLTGDDVRRVGSGATGARNVGRVLGPIGFAVTCLLDAAKGAAAVLGASYLGLNPLGATLVLVAVVCGHIWPVQLGFRGGKGVATGLGALALYDLQVVLAIVGLFLPLFAVFRAFVASGLLAFALAPVVLVLLGAPLVHVAGAAAVGILIGVAHRENICGGLRPARWRAALGEIGHRQG
jgi:glycerol-3-phosphate acyltransferase PlsY